MNKEKIGNIKITGFCSGIKCITSGPEGQEMYSKMNHFLGIGREKVTLELNSSGSIVSVSCKKLDIKNNTCLKSGQPFIPCGNLISKDYLI